MRGYCVRCCALSIALYSSRLWVNRLCAETISGPLERGILQLVLSGPVYMRSVAGSRSLSQVRPSTAASTTMPTSTGPRTHGSGKQSKRHRSCELCIVQYQRCCRLRPLSSQPVFDKLVSTQRFLRSPFFWSVYTSLHALYTRWLNPQLRLPSSPSIRSLTCLIQSTPPAVTSLLLLRFRSLA